MESYISQPGLVDTDMNRSKLDPGKFVTKVVSLATSMSGQRAEIAAACLQRPATDPSLAGMRNQPVRSSTHPASELACMHVDLTCK